MVYCTDDTTGNKFWDFVGHLLHKPSAEQVKCHHPKPILLDVGMCIIIWL